MIYLKITKKGSSKEDDIATPVFSVLLGCAPDDTVQLSGNDVHAHHAVIDAVSLNIDTFKPDVLLKVNGESVSSRTLDNGDIITIGDYTIRFFHSGAVHDAAVETKTWKVPTLKSRTK